MHNISFPVNENSDLRLRGIKKRLQSSEGRTLSYKSQLKESKQHACFASASSSKSLGLSV